MTNSCQWSIRCKCLVMTEMMTAAMELAVEDLLLFGRENGIELLDRLHTTGCPLLCYLQERRQAYENLGASPINPQVTSFKVLDEHTVSATYTVDRDHANQAADCIVYAQSADGSEVQSSSSARFSMRHTKARGSGLVKQ